MTTWQRWPARHWWHNGKFRTFPLTPLTVFVSHLGGMKARLLWRSRNLYIIIITCPEVNILWSIQTVRRVVYIILYTLRRVTHGQGMGKNSIDNATGPVMPVAAPGRQGRQVISRSLRSWGRSSGANASAVEEPGHFEVRKSSSQVTGCTFLPKKLTFFSRGPQNTGRQRRWLFHCQNKRNKSVRYGNIFIFC